MTQIQPSTRQQAKQISQLKRFLCTVSSEYYQLEKQILSPYKEALAKSMKEQQMKNKITQKQQEFAQNLVKLITVDQ